MSRVQVNFDNYILLDSVYSELSEHIDHIPMLLARAGIEPIYLNDEEYIGISEYLRIKDLLTLKRNSKEITINKNKFNDKNKLNDNLLEFSAF